jgi:hypothetical protein
VKKYIFIILLLLASVSAFSQNSMVTVNGGYAGASIKDAETGGSGYRINGMYEYHPAIARWSHGIEFGYIHLTSSNDGVNVTVNSFPSYYVPKIIFGSDKFKYYLKGALGMQIASIHREGNSLLDDTDMGFYLGGGGGIMLFLGESFFLNADYEIAYASNAYYRDGWINSVTAGIGFRF